MITTPDKRLLEWVRRFKADLTPEGTITRIELYHSIEGEMGERLATFEMVDRDEDEDPDDLAQEIWNQAEDDAAMRPEGSHQRYTVRAFRGDVREPDEQKSFVVLGKLVSALVGNGSEPPTARGELAAEMRRTNDLHAIVVRMAQDYGGSAVQALQHERVHTMKLTEANYKLREQMENQLDRAQERELARKRAEESAAQNAMVWQGLGQLLPLVLQRLLAPSAPSTAALPLQPQAPAADASTQPAAAAAPTVPDAVAQRDREMHELLQSITPGQVQELVTTFTDKQTERFLGIYTSFRESPPAPANGAPAPQTPTPHN